MAYEDIYIGAKEAEEEAERTGGDGYAAFHRVVSENIRARLAGQDALLAKARAARRAADLLLYEGHRAVDDAEYVAACKVADELGDLARAPW